jgi:uncharacterized iron-regulated protein
VRLVQIVVAAAAVACGGPQSSARGAASSAAADSQPSLAGRVYRVSDRTFVDRRTLLDDLATARFVLLGEVHDSEEAHRAQRNIVEALLARGRHPAIVFEMIDSDRQPAINATRQSGVRDADAFSDAVGFDRAGWPWRFYRPLVAIALENDLPIVAGNAPRAETRSLVMRGLASVDASRTHLLGLDTPLDADAQAALRSDMRESHCNMLPEQMLDGMGLAQRARDGSLAERMVSAGREAVLIAGAGHARIDRGVPVRLRALAPDSSVRSVGFVEVDPHELDPPAYAARFRAATLPFDVVWFVAPVRRDRDQCEQLGHRSGSPR